MKIDLATLFANVDMPADVRDRVTKLAALATSCYGAEGIAAWNKALALVERYGALALPPPPQPPGASKSGSATRFASAVGYCRYCGQSVVWTVTSNGRRMPVDVEPSTSLDCGFVLHYDGTELRSIWTRAWHAAGRPLYASHLSTCAGRRAA